MWERQFRTRDGHRSGLSLDEFFGLTSYQLFRQFFAWRGESAAAAKQWDAVEITAEVNRRQTEAGRLPVIPKHMFKGIPRIRRGK